MIINWELFKQKIPLGTHVKRTGPVRWARRVISPRAQGPRGYVLRKKETSILTRVYEDAKIFVKIAPFQCEHEISYPAAELVYLIDGNWRSLDDLGVQE